MLLGITYNILYMLYVICYWGSGIVELENRATNYDAIKPS